MSALLGLAACDTTSSTIPDLGDGYAVEMQPTPLLDGDVLRVSVSYSGGCEDHTFELAYWTAGPEPELWLTHDSNDDPCEAYITEALALRVPREALEGRPVHLYINETETIVLNESLQN
ncbi:MAG: hypothetical protein Rubg2KO_18840 [Rubricoccaceae bacterium]